MMKSKILMLAAALTFAACDPASPGLITKDSAECNLFVNCSFGATKVAGQTQEAAKQINNLSVFVFRTDPGHKLDASAYSDSGEAMLQLRCTIGEKIVYVLVNSASDCTYQIRCEADLLALSSSLNDNGLSNLFMMGKTTQTLSGTSCALTVPVSRLVSSVRLEKISNRMEANGYRADGLFTVDAVYLTNVVGTWSLDGTTDPHNLGESGWLARLEKQVQALICDDGIGRSVNYGEELNEPHTFYAFPNSCELKEDPVWSPRSTMLVVEATLDGVKYYYPVAVGPLEANKQYVINNFIIRRPGSNHPWEVVHKTDVTVQIEVVPWSEPRNVNEDI